MWKKIIYVDSFSIGTFHEMYNASSLKMFSEIFDKVDYYTSNEIFSNTKKTLKDIPLNVYFKRLFIPNIQSRIGHFLRQFMPIFTNSFVLLKANKNDIIFINYNALWALGTVNFLSKILQRRVIIMCHGEMEFLLNDTNLNCLSRRTMKKFKSKSFRPARNIYFCVLGQSIKNNLKDIVAPLVQEKLISFEHSYIFRKKVKHLNSSSTQIKIGALGALRTKKGLEGLKSLSQILKKQHNFVLYSIGRIYCDKHILDSAGIHIVPESDKRFLTRKEIDNTVSNLDYILILYPQEGYRFTASGALYDAIDCEKPILALTNDYIKNVFDSCNEIGILFNTELELINHIKNLKKKDVLTDYKKIKQKLGTKAIGKKFKLELKNLDWTIN